MKFGITMAVDGYEEDAPFVLFGAEVLAAEASAEEPMSSIVLAALESLLGKHVFEQSQVGATSAAMTPRFASLRDRT